MHAGRRAVGKPAARRPGLLRMQQALDHQPIKPLF
jgi:hypothetical protein